MKPAVFFLHGFPNNARLWEQQTRHLGHLGELITPDWGARSEAGWLDAAVADLVERASRLRAAEPRRPVFLVGHDLGCFIVSEAVRLQPELFAGQVLINGAGLESFSRRWNRSGQWLRSSYVTLLLTLPFLNAIAGSHLGERIRQGFYSLGGVGRRSRIRLPRYNDVRAVKVYRELFVRALRALGRRSEPSPVPASHLAGRRDPFLVPPSARELRRVLRPCLA